MRSDVGLPQRTGVLRLLLLISVAASISACSIVRIGYELAPWYTARQLDAWWQLDPTQSAFGRARVDELWRWQRRSELPEIARWLRSVNARIDGGVDIDEVSGWRRTGLLYWERTVRPLSPGLASLMNTLRPEQIEAMSKRMVSDNEDYRREFLPDDLAERQARRVKRIEDKLEYFLGELTEAQRELVLRKASAMPYNEEVWFAERLARQRDLAELVWRLSSFGSPLVDAQLERANQQVLDFLLPLWEPHDPQRRQALAGVLRASDDITAAVLSTARPDQKARLSARLVSWANDLEALSRK